MDYKNSNTLLLSKKRYTKQDKINNYRKKYSNIRHQYYAMCDKYSSYNKLMLTFTIPSKINNAIIQGKYSKTAYLVELRTYIAKQFNNSSCEIKYFSNIELGSNRNNPHLHIQVWTKDHNENKGPNLSNNEVDQLCQYNKRALNINKVQQNTHKDHINILGHSINDNSIRSNNEIKGPNNYDDVRTIFNRTIEKFNLNNSRCKLSTPTHDKLYYDYVIKDYRKDISDVEIWANENAKKGIRKHLGKQVRFYNMSKDKYSQKLYKFVYRLYRKLRLYANEFIDCLASIFKGLSVDELLVIRELKSDLLGILEQEVYECFNLGYSIKKTIHHIEKLISYWIYGFI